MPKKKEKSEKPKMSQQEKVSLVTKWVLIIIGGVLLLIILVTLIDNYLTRWRYQQEMAAVTNEVNQTKTYNNQTVVTYETLQSELRAANIADGYTDSERLALLEKYYAELMSYNSAGVSAITVQPYSAYNAPALEIVYTQASSAGLVSSSPSSTANSTPTLEETTSSSAVSENEAVAPEETAAEVDNDQGSEDTSSEESTESQAPIEPAIVTPPVSTYTPPDIGLNNVMESDVPPKPSFIPKDLQTLLQRILNETEIAYVIYRVTPNQGSEQMYYMTKTALVPLHGLNATAELQYDGNTSTGWETKEQGEYTLYIGWFPSSTNFTDVVDAYLDKASECESNTTPEIVGIAYGEEYIFYVDDIYSTLGVFDSLQNLTPNQQLYRRVRYYYETQVMSEKFLESFLLMLQHLTAS